MNSRLFVVICDMFNIVNIMRIILIVDSILSASVRSSSSNHEDDTFGGIGKARD